MYRACLFCHRDLGDNEVIEHFPIGRRLAFDAAKGRLWVVCRKCGRWNLTPLEERWEAIEECERAFSSTRTRASTDNIGLASVRGGLDLVRIGQPLRPEFASWRYGDQFGRRVRQRVYFGLAGSAVVIAAGLAGPIGGSAVGIAASMIQIGHTVGSVYAHRRVRARIARPDGGSPVPIRWSSAPKVMVITEGHRWGLQLPSRRNEDPIVLEGETARRAASAILPMVNYQGATAKSVAEAVSVVEQHGTLDRLFASSTRRSWKVNKRANRWVLGDDDDGSPGTGIQLRSIPHSTLLALEMATHEDVERRALEGELALLEEAWKQAEEIAHIADNLALPDDADPAKLDRRAERSTED